jgi:transposase
MEYAVQSNVIRGLTKEQYQILRELCQYSNNLYNVALYNIRQYFFSQNKFLTYESNYHECKDNENYSLLQAGVSQQTLKVVDRSFKSFFNLLKKCRQGEYRYNDVKIPHYRKKGGLFNLILSTNAISIKDGYFKIPMSREYRKLMCPPESPVHYVNAATFLDCGESFRQMISCLDAEKETELTDDFREM